MPRDGSGNYTQPVSSVSPAVTNTTISPTDFNTLTTDLSTEMTDSLDRSGKGAMLAGLAMGGFKITNVGAPAASTDAARLTDLTIGGDVGGTLAANTVNKIQGTTVTGTTGTGNAVLSAGATHTGITTIAGITNATIPGAGNIGQYISPRNGGSVSSNIVSTAVSLSLTAGNWMLVGQTQFTTSG